MTFDNANQCWTIENSIEVSCLSNDEMCSEAITYAHAPDSDECWYFTNSCIPEGWTTCPYPDEPECR